MKPTTINTCDLSCMYGEQGGGRSKQQATAVDHNPHLTRGCGCVYTSSKKYAHFLLRVAKVVPLRLNRAANEQQGGQSNFMTLLHAACLHACWSWCMCFCASCRCTAAAAATINTQLILISTICTTAAACVPPDIPNAYPQIYRKQAIRFRTLARKFLLRLNVNGSSDH